MGCSYVLITESMAAYRTHVQVGIEKDVRNVNSWEEQHAARDTTDDNARRNDDRSSCRISTYWYAFLRIRFSSRLSLAPTHGRWLHLHVLRLFRLVGHGIIQ
jgi:hypothetical protein